MLLLDEPTHGLDVLGSQVVAEFVTHLRGEGKAVILTTHRLDEAERLCDRFGLMHEGRLVSEGTLAELRQATGAAGLVEMFLDPGAAGTGSEKRERCHDAASRTARLGRLRARSCARACATGERSSRSC